MLQTPNRRAVPILHPQIDDQIILTAATAAATGCAITATGTPHACPCCCLPSFLFPKDGKAAIKQVSPKRLYAGDQ
jgi:hypothetical protein